MADYSTLTNAELITELNTRDQTILDMQTSDGVITTVTGMSDAEQKAFAQKVYTTKAGFEALQKMKISH